MAILAGVPGTFLACIMFAAGFWILLVTNMRVRQFMLGQSIDWLRAGLMMIWGAVLTGLGLLGIADEGFTRLWVSTLAAIVGAAAASALWIGTVRRFRDRQAQRHQ